MGNLTCACETSDQTKEEMSKEFQLTSKAVQSHEIKQLENQYSQQNQVFNSAFSQNYQSHRLPSVDQSDMYEPKKTERMDQIQKMINQESQYDYQTELDQMIEQNIKKQEISIEHQKNKSNTSKKQSKKNQSAQSDINEKYGNESNESDISTQVNFLSPQDQKKIEKLLEIYNNLEKNFKSQNQNKATQFKQMLKIYEEQKEQLNEQKQEKQGESFKQDQIKEKLDQMFMFYTQLEQEQYSYRTSLPLQIDQNTNRFSSSDKVSDSLKLSSEFNPISPTVKNKKTLNQYEILKDQLMQASPLQSIDFRYSENTLNSNYENQRQIQIDQEIQTSQSRNLGQEKFTQTPIKENEIDIQSNWSQEQLYFRNLKKEISKSKELKEKQMQKNSSRNQHSQIEKNLQQIPCANTSQQSQNIAQTDLVEYEDQQYQFVAKQFKGKGLIQSSQNIQAQTYNKPSQQSLNISQSSPQYQKEFDKEENIYSIKITSPSKNVQKDLGRYDIKQQQSQQEIQSNQIQYFKDINISPIQKKQMPVPYPNYHQSDQDQKNESQNFEKKNNHYKYQSDEKSLNISNQESEFQHQPLSQSYEINNSTQQSRIQINYEYPEVKVQKFNNEVIIYEGYLLKYKPGPGIQFIKRFCQITQYKFQYFKSNLDANA